MSDVPMDRPVIECRGLSKSFREGADAVDVLRDVSLSVARGESVALTGESGSGKGTLLHLIAGLDRADGGEIVLDGTEVSRLSDSARAALRRDRLGLVFQQFNLIPSLQVGDNLAFQARIAIPNAAVDLPLPGPVCTASTGS